MKRKRFTEEQISLTLYQTESGLPMGELCRRLRIVQTIFYRWKRKYGGLSVSDLRGLCSRRDENSKLKPLVTDLTLDKTVLQETIREEL